MLDVILKKLHGRHRVLIFSQMTRVLDVLVRTTWPHDWPDACNARAVQEDYLRLRDYSYLRLDGQRLRPVRQPTDARCRRRHPGVA
jgi:hypothetical protein